MPFVRVLHQCISHKLLCEDVLFYFNFYSYLSFTYLLLSIFYILYLSILFLFLCCCQNECPGSPLLLRIFQACICFLFPNYIVLKHYNSLHIHIDCKSYYTVWHRLQSRLYKTHYNIQWTRAVQHIDIVLILCYNVRGCIRFCAFPGFKGWIPVKCCNCLNIPDCSVVLFALTHVKSTLLSLSIKNPTV